MAPVAWPQRRVAESTRLEMSLGGFIIGVFGGARGDGAARDDVDDGEILGN